MPRKRTVIARTIPEAAKPYLRDTPIIPGKPLLPGRATPTFPAFYRVEERLVTFRSCGGSHDDRVAHYERAIRLANARGEVVMILIPHAIYANPKTVIFHAAWTLVAVDGDIRTHQCVVFLGGEAVPVGTSDQGVICAIARDSLSAWDGRTEDASRRQAA